MVLLLAGVGVDFGGVVGGGFVCWLAVDAKASAHKSMVVVVGVAVDDDVGAVWLAIDANTSAHTSMVVVVVVVVGNVAVVGQRFAALVVQRFAAQVSVHVRRPLVVNCSLVRSRP